MTRSRREKWRTAANAEFDFDLVYAGSRPERLDAAESGLQKSTTWNPIERLKNIHIAQFNIRQLGMLNPGSCRARTSRA